LPLGQSARVYRPDIDGLRAVSIVCVVLFHLKVPAFPGGYIGVDVFFVISGYLITQIILDELDAGTFSLARFYVRRIRRLFPALFVVVAATFIAAMAWFPPELLRNVARDTVTTLAAVSNVFFWRAANDYFSANLQSTPLLHTWSLSVEEQFYLFWSAGLLALTWLGLRRLLPALVLVAVFVSLAACQVWLTRDANAAFYLMPFRIFELGIGALCLTAERCRSCFVAIDDVAFGIGIAAIVYAAVAFGTTTPFPGLYALVPCIGAALVIYGGARTRLRIVLSNKVAVGLGLISYSLYLCHWPILIFSDWIFGGPYGALGRGAQFAASVAVATLLYFYVERPFRRQAGPITVRTLAGVLLKTATVGSVVFIPALVAVQQDGWAWRVSEAQRETGRLHSFGYAPCVADGQTCVFGDPTGPVGMVVIGDSYAQHIVAGFQPLLVRAGLKGIAQTYGGCLMLMGIESAGPVGVLPHCQAAKRQAFEAVRNAPALIVINHSWLTYGPGSIAADDGRVQPTKAAGEEVDVYHAALENTVAELGGAHRHFLVVGAQPFNTCGLEPFRLQLGPFPRPVAFCSPTSAERMHATTDAFNRMLRDFERRHAGIVSVLIPTDYLCDPDCPLTSNGLWLYQDKGHFTIAGAEYFGRKIEGRVRALLSVP